jgi:hypothetical protein
VRACVPSREQCRAKISATAHRRGRWGRAVAAASREWVTETTMSIPGNPYVAPARRCTYAPESTMRLGSQPEPEVGALVASDSEDFLRAMENALAMPVTRGRLSTAPEGAPPFTLAVVHLPIPPRRPSPEARRARLERVAVLLGRSAGVRCVVAEDLDVETVSVLATGRVHLFPEGVDLGALGRDLESGRSERRQLAHFATAAEMAAVGEWAAKVGWTADQRRLLLLDLQGTASIADLGEMTGKAAGTVEVQLTRALAKLRSASGRSWTRNDLRARLHREAMRIRVMMDRLWDAPGDV